jgi:hypothetical protein
MVKILNNEVTNVKTTSEQLKNVTKLKIRTNISGDELGSAKGSG